MSESTGGNQKPDPDKDDHESQDQSSGPVFNDPTAPVWADPTAPIPPPPPPPAAPGSAWVQDDPPAPPPAPPMSNPYAQQPPAQPYAQPAQPYGQPAQPYGQPDQSYGQPQAGQPFPAYGQQNYATGAGSSPSNTSAIVLTIVSGLAMLTTCVIGIPSLVFGIMALTSNSSDPVGSRKKSRTGWIIFAINAGVAVVAFIAIVAVLIVSTDGGRSSFNSGY